MSSRRNHAKPGIPVTPELTNLVFGNELILDQILQFILPNGRRSSIKHILECRLVDRTWHKLATKLFTKLTKPVFTLDFTHWKDSKEMQNELEMKYQVQNFFDTWVTSPDACSSIPPFKLIFPEFSEVEADVLYDFAKCLMRCGNGVHTLKLDLSSGFLVNYDAIPETLINTVSKVHLPNLHSLKIYLPSRQNRNSLVHLLVTPILLRCKRLECLCISQNDLRVQVPWTSVFQKDNLSGETDHLPATLKQIDIRMKMEPRVLEKLLLDNSLPNLIKLNLQTLKRPAYKQVIYQILDRFRLQLTEFSLTGVLYGDEEEMHQNERNSVTLVRFPVMPKLKHMFIYSLHFESEPRMEQYFPALMHLMLLEQTNSMLLNLTRNCEFDCVNNLTIMFDTDRSVSDDDCSFTLELSRQLPRAFPHVRNLELTLTGLVEDGSIQNIFECMTQLQHLSITLQRPTINIGSLTWNAILIGATQEFARNLESAPERWGSFELEEHWTPSRSIINLSNLETLLLKTYEFREHGENLLISDVAFRFAFLYMPKLRKLNLSGKFRASEEMTTEWRRQGRKISSS